jgi:hypothetical protein
VNAAAVRFPERVLQVIQQNCSVRHNVSRWTQLGVSVQPTIKFLARSQHVPSRAGHRHPRFCPALCGRNRHSQVPGDQPPSTQQIGCGSPVSPGIFRIARGHNGIFDGIFHCSVTYTREAALDLPDLRSGHLVRCCGFPASRICVKQRHDDYYKCRDQYHWRTTFSNHHH